MCSYSIYVHLPFCMDRCSYCDFFSSTPSEIPFAAYRETVCREWHLRKEIVSGWKLKSVYFGGGTPSLWPANEISGLLDCLPIAPGMEVTVEANPQDVSPEWFAGLLKAGVSRFSIGVQALDDARLKMLGRRHDRVQAANAIKMAKCSGVTSVSADLIYGTPEHGRAELVREVRELVELGVDHISAYELTIASGTRFEKEVADGKFQQADDRLLVELWSTTGDFLETCGFERYEVSNYSRPGNHCKHNEHYWTGGFYIGLGAGAYGFLKDDKGKKGRYGNVENVKEYIVSESEDEWVPTRGIGRKVFFDEISRETHGREKMMLGLRTTSGVSFSEAWLGVSKSTFEHWRGVTARLIEQRLVRLESGRLIPTLAGLLHADTLAQKYF
jgi:putative oxygen-independent coproporphyrinogen III oxidase